MPKKENKKNVVEKEKEKLNNLLLSLIQINKGVSNNIENKKANPILKRQ